MTYAEIVTDTGAAAAVVSPLWLPSLHEVSAEAALILPILGAVWLSVQIFHRIYMLRKEYLKGKNDH